MTSVKKKKIQRAAIEVGYASTVDQEIFAAKFFSPLGHTAKIKHANISCAKISHVTII